MEKNCIKGGTAKMHKFMKKIAIMVSVALIIVFCISLVATAQDIDLKSPSAVLMDQGTGKVLFEKNPHEKLPPASITKIMTLLIAMEALESGKINLDDKVVISKNAWGMGGSQVFLGIGEEQTVENLLKAITIASGNDASVALAEHIAGSLEGFVKLMNQRAEELGMKNTNFENPHGLHSPNHYSTAYDIALMSRELLKHELVFKWTTVWLDYLEHTDKPRDATMLSNTNKLIKYYKGADGLKTGSHSNALYCLSATAKRGPLRLISIIMKAPTSTQRFDEAAKLLDHGFANFSAVEIIKSGEIVKSIPVEKGKESEVDLVAEETLTILVNKGQEEGITQKLHFPQKVKAPIIKGQKLGEIIATKDGNIIGQVDIVSEKDVPRLTFIEMISKIIKQMLQSVK
jgi:D-alanyl-D-alanine carboxypeptidase (penicillin-binding protein 5/6)